MKGNVPVTSHRVFVVCRGKWGKADYLRNSMQYFFTECLYLTKGFSIG